MQLGDFKDVSNGSLFNARYYRTRTFWNIVLITALAIGDIATFARNLYRHDYSLFVKAWLPLFGLIIVIGAGVGISALWLSRMRAMFSGPDNADINHLVKKIAGDYIRLFALLIICVMVGLFVAQNICGY